MGNWSQNDCSCMRWSQWWNWRWKPFCWHLDFSAAGALSLPRVCGAILADAGECCQVNWPVQSRVFIIPVVPVPTAFVLLK